MDIVVTGDRSISGYSGINTGAATPAAPAPSLGGDSSGEDHISVTPATSRIQTTLSALSSSQATRVSKLRDLYGAYDANSTKIAQALVSGASGETGRSAVKL